MKEQFLLDPNIIFLNHGSFGACPHPVFDKYQEWQRRLEHEPVDFLLRQAGDLLAEARAVLADYIGCDADEVVYTSNPTTAANFVAHSLDLQPRDEILATDHEYGAMDRTWHFICKKTGATYRQQPIPLPVSTPEAFVETFWSAVTSQTKVIFLSHLISPTALIFQVQEICQRARQAGILTIIDGAHAPGHIPIDMEDIGADFYTGACHNWWATRKQTDDNHLRSKQTP